MFFIESFSNHDHEKYFKMLSNMPKYKLSNHNYPLRSSLCTNRIIVQSVAFGGVSGVLCHYWYNHLDRIYSASNHRQIKIVIKKILCDQIIFSPILIVACLLAACIMNGREKENIFKEVTHKGKIFARFSDGTAIPI